MTQNSSVLPLQYSGAILYKHSGAVPVTASIAGIVGGIVTAILGGIAYAYADIYSPVDKLNLLITLVFGALLGFVPAYLMHRTKARNPRIVAAIALCTALLGYYVCWVAWICGVYDRLFEGPRDFGYLTLITHPRWMWEVIQGLNESGTWSTAPVGSTTHHDAEHGTFLWIIWIAEAIGIFLTAIFAALAVGKGQPFCEECNAWCGAEKPLATLRADDIPGIKQRMLARDFTTLAANRVGSGDHYIAITQHNCATCNQLHTLSATEITITYTKKGKQSTNKKVLVNKLLVMPDELAPFTAPPPQPMAPMTPPLAPPSMPTNL